jgi:hypothetical protein
VCPPRKVCDVAARSPEQSLGVVGLAAGSLDLADPAQHADIAHPGRLPSDVLPGQGLSRGRGPNHWSRGSAARGATSSTGWRGRGSHAEPLLGSYSSNCSTSVKHSFTAKRIDRSLVI